VAKCQGAGEAPATIYKAIHYYPLRNGKQHYSGGYGSCARCNRVLRTRPKGEDTVLVAHSPAKQPWDTGRRQWAERYRKMTEIIRHPPVSTYSRPVNQTVTVNRGYDTLGLVRHEGTGGVTRFYTHVRDHPFEITMTSSTTNTAGQYIFNINGLPTAAMTNTVTLMTDTYTWSRWNEQYTISTNAYIANQTIWERNWVGYGVQAYNGADVQREVARRGLTYARPVETPEERQARQQAEALALFQRVEAERLATQSASERALGTLLGLLTEEQREEYARFNYFHVVGSKGRLYRIHKGSSGNIRRVVSRTDPGKGEAAFCVHSVSRIDRTMEQFGLVAGHLPHEDHMIQQMLHLQIDEDEILAKANVHWGTREPTDAELERFFAAEEANQRERQTIGV
jgi:hypothetical protein